MCTNLENYEKFSIIIISIYEGIKIYIIEIYICAYNQTHIRHKIRKKLEIYTAILEKNPH